MPTAKVLDPCSASRMMYFDKNDNRVIFCDKRNESHVLCDGRALEISPEVQCDFTNLPFADNTFHLVVFDPPHSSTLNPTAYLALKYGRLIGDWRDMIRSGFAECFRVLKPNGTLVFKWNEIDIPLAEILGLTPNKPLFGHRSGKRMYTHWMTFLKEAPDADR